jgi:hypothetical protein
VFTGCVKILVQKKYWPVSDLDPDPGFGSETNFRQDPDPKPDPKLLFQIRNTEIKYKNG